MNTGSRVHANYLRDLGCILKEMAVEAKRARDSATRAQDRAYATGRLMALHDAVSLMQEQATSFGIQQEELCLGDIDPERDLV